MKIEDFLSPTDVIVGQRAQDKLRLLRELSARAAASLGLGADLVAQEIQKREELGSTGMGAGIAIPHARIVGLQKPFGVLARLKKGIEFDAIDGRPVDLVFLLLLPAEAQTDCLNALAAVARKFRESERLQRLREAGDGAALYRELTR
jgi:PTS system nitrogen regulatory IIA component